MNFCMITKKQVEHIAKLARLKLSGQEIEKFQKDFSGILEYFEILEKANVSLVEPMTHSVIIKNATRNDDAKKERPEIIVKLVENAPEHEKGYIKVPEVFS